MAELSFKEWVERKVEEDRKNVDARRRDDWLLAYGRLKDSIYQWLKEDAGEEVVFKAETTQRHERALGIYDIDEFWIQIGHSAVEVVPAGRNVMARVNPPEGGEFPAQGRVDIKGGGGNTTSIAPSRMEKIGGMSPIPSGIRSPTGSASRICL